MTEVTVICNNCGFETPPHNYCSQCGHELKIMCPHCSNYVTNYNYCEKCGEILHGMWLIKKNHIDNQDVLHTELLPSKYKTRQEAELEAKALSKSDPFHDYIVVAYQVRDDESLDILVAWVLGLDGEFSEIFNSRKMPMS